MVESKLIHIFKSFTKTEKSGLRRWVNSEVHNQREDVIKMLDLLLSRRKITAVSVKRERVFKQLFPGEEYNMTRLNHLMSMTASVMEEYIKFLMSKEKPFQEEILLHLYYKRKNIGNLANKALLKARTHIDSELNKNTEFYHDSFSLEIAEFDLIGTEQRRHKTNLEDIFDNLATFTIITTLKYAGIALSHKRLFKKDYRIPMLEAILKEASKDIYKENTVVLSYYYSYMALLKPDEEHYFIALRDILLNKEAPLKTEELKQLCLMAINYCIKKLNSGEEKYVQEVLFIYKFGLKHEIWIENGFLSHNTFKNIATAALRLKEYDWTESFIEGYSRKIKLSHQKDYTNFVKAKLLFEKAAFSDAQNLLIDTDSIDMFIGMAIRVMLLKVYWELKEFELLEAHLDSFAVYLNRKKILAYHREVHSKTISIMRKIVNANLANQTERQQLKQMIIQTNPLPERPWLLQQLKPKENQ